jgi:Tol biopolymer transport system component
MKKNLIPLMIEILSVLVLAHCRSITDSHTADTKVFYTSNQDGNFEIYEISNIADAKINRLTDTVLNEQFLVPSPDGSRLIFDYGGTRLERDIFLLDVSSGMIAQLTSASAYDIPGDWSPIGDQIAFISDRDSGFYHLYIMNADGTNQRTIPLATSAERNVHSVDWSPSSALILYTIANDSLTDPSMDMFIVNIDTLEILQINTVSTGMCTEGAWSLDGEQIVAICDAGVYLVSLHTNEVIHLSKTKELADCHSPEWNPNKQWIAFLCRDADNEIGLYVVRSDDSELRHLPHGVTGDLVHLKDPKWLKNGQQLIYIAESDSTNFIMLVGLDGKSRELVQEQATLRFLSVAYLR